MIRKNLAVLLPLYVAQGLPYGFQVTALPLLLRASGASLAAIGFAGLLALPWLTKAPFAPLVDRFGTYKRWILPLQLLMCATALVSAALASHLVAVVACVLALNFFAATQDVAVDGLAVRTLQENELGPANAIQVAGYKVGMLLGGGLLLMLEPRFGWSGVFAGMAAVIALVAALTFLFVEDGKADTKNAEKKSFREIAHTLWEAAKHQGPAILLVIGTYKIGETMIDAMFKPFLVDQGFLLADIGMWLGTYGMIASLVGSAAGGAFARYAGIERAVVWAAMLRAPAMFGEWWLTQTPPTADLVIAVNVAEHLTGGLLTTCMFALMMKRTERSIGATHYTLLATVEVFGKSPASWGSGFLAERFGYTGLFLTGAVVSTLYVFVAGFVLRRRSTG